MIVESFGELSYHQNGKEWFGLVENISPNNKVELSICVDSEHEDLSEKIILIKKLVADFNLVMENLYNLAHLKYKDTQWEKSKEEIKKMYFLTAVNLRIDNTTWWLVLEPAFEVETIYDHFLRFTMVGREIVWTNFDTKTA
jgi:hypothetical protein